MSVSASLCLSLCRRPLSLVISFSFSPSYSYLPLSLFDSRFFLLPLISFLTAAVCLSSACFPPPLLPLRLMSPYVCLSVCPPPLSLSLEILTERTKVIVQIMNEGTRLAVQILTKRDKIDYSNNVGKDKHSLSE